MASNEDLLSYLKDMEERRARERKEDKAEYKLQRERERKEDREETRKVIQSCVEEKLNAAIKPLEENNEIVVKAQEQMKEQVDILAEKLKKLQEKVDTNTNCTHTHSEVAVQEQVRLQLQDLKTGGQLAGAQSQAVVGGQGEGLAEIISVARRTVGLFRIDQADLHRMRQPQYGSAKSPEEEKLLAVREYLKLELKLDPILVNKMEIENMFYTTKDNPECLFVTFKYRSSVSRIFEKTYIMRKESRVKNYIPRQFMDRARAIGEIEFNLREREKCRTKLKMGIKDLELFRKDRNCGKWELVPLTAADLPPVDLGVSGSPSRSETGSPAPGRPSQNRTEKRSRESTGSNGGGSNAKTARKEGEDHDDDKEEVSEFTRALVEADLVSDTAVASPSEKVSSITQVKDHGIVTSISGTPSKPAQLKENHVVESPVFKKISKSY